MSETSEESNNEPPRCKCGFWGSTKTMGLCSKCYADFKKSEHEVEQETSSTQTPDSVSAAEVLSKEVAKAVAQAATEAHSGKSGTDDAVTADPNSDSGEKSSSDSNTDGEEKGSVDQQLKEDSPSKKRDISDVSDAEVSPSKPAQKNKKKCFKCKAKLELAYTEIGRCKCDYVFCSMHRLPEQHDCTYDHKKAGRKEAADKMVKPTRHVGRSFHRMDSK